MTRRERTPMGQQYGCHEGNRNTGIQWPITVPRIYMDTILLGRLQTCWEEMSGKSVWCQLVLWLNLRPLWSFNRAAPRIALQLSARYLPETRTWRFLGGLKFCHKWLNCRSAMLLNWPAANLFLMREKRYPGPASSISQPESVLPSLVNCTARGAGLLGPSVSWNRANNDPTPEKWKTFLS